MRDLFSDHGVSRWLDRLRESDEFRSAAAGWTGTVVLTEDDSPSPRSTWIAVADGQVSARLATDGDRQEAEFVLAASPDTWQRLTSGELALVSAAMNGQLRLVRGNLFKLIPHAKAAAALLAAAG